MTNNDGIDVVINDLSERAHAVVNEGHNQMAILKSAMADFKSIGSLSGMMSIAATGKLNPQQVELAKRIAVKVIAVLGMTEAHK